jgi:hypothetical protein
MTSTTLSAQHRERANNHTRQAQRDMNSHDHRQKDWIGGRNFNSRHACGVADHTMSCDRVFAPSYDEFGKCAGSASLRRLLKYLLTRD